MQPPNNQLWQQYPLPLDTSYPSHPQYPQPGQSQQPYSFWQLPSIYMPLGLPPQRPKKRQRLVVVLAVFAVALTLCISVSVAASNTLGTTTTFTKSTPGAPTSPATHTGQQSTVPTTTARLKDQKSNSGLVQASNLNG